MKSEYKTGIKRGRDDVDADGDDFQITMSRPVRFKPAAGKAKTIKLESDTKGEIRLATKSTKSKQQVEGSRFCKHVCISGKNNGSVGNMSETSVPYVLNPNIYPRRKENPENISFSNIYDE